MLLSFSFNFGIIELDSGISFPGFLGSEVVSPFGPSYRDRRKALFILSGFNALWLGGRSG